jgi:MFS family permease
MGFASAFGLSVTLSSVTPSYFTYALTLPLCGSLALTTMIAANSYVQTNSDGAIRGRVLGIYLLIFMGGSPFGAPLIGWMCTQIGIRQTIAGCGLITTVAAVAIYIAYAGRMDRPASIAVEDVLAFKKN